MDKTYSMHLRPYRMHNIIIEYNIHCIIIQTNSNSTYIIFYDIILHVQCAYCIPMLLEYTIL